MGTPFESRVPFKVCEGGLYTVRKCSNGLKQRCLVAIQQMHHQLSREGNLMSLLMNSSDI